MLARKETFICPNEVERNSLRRVLSFGMRQFSGSIFADAFEYANALVVAGCVVVVCMGFEAFDRRSYASDSSARTALS